MSGFGEQPSRIIIPALCKHILTIILRSLPLEGPSQVPLHDNSNKLAPQLGHSILHPLPRQLRSRKCQSAEQDLLYLVCVLLFVHYVCVFYDL